MAFSQVEIVASSPFGCTTVVHNGRNRCFQSNLNDLVTTCIPNNNSRHIDYADLWVHHPQWQTTPTQNHCRNGRKGNTTVDDEENEEDNSNNDDSIHRGGKIEPNHLKDKWARARQMVFSIDSSSPEGCDCNSPTLSEGSVSEIPNLQGGVSSLVRKWRGLEAEGKCSKSNSSGTAFSDSACFAAPANTAEEDYTLGDWESDRTIISGPPSARNIHSDATERERIRVADIIRKLTEDRTNDVGCDSSPRLGMSSSSDYMHPHQSDTKKRFSPIIVNSPRIRGRQAFTDLLMQMERERHNELERLVSRKIVSKFSQRGRIQAALRVRFLRRGMDFTEDLYSNDAACESHKSMRSAFLLSRERANTSFSNHLVQSGSQPSKDDQNKHHEVPNSVNYPRLGADHIQGAEENITSIEHDVNLNFLEVDQKRQQNTNQLHNSDRMYEKSCQLPPFIWQETTSESNNHSLVESASTTKSLQTIQVNVHPKDEETTNHELESEGDSRHLKKSAPCYTSVVSHLEAGLEELDSNNQHQVENNIDWIYDVSRPRSDWEGLRQARYQEMLDPFLENDEIRVLLGRKSVSNFLSSGLREQIDKVMRSRAQGQRALLNNQTREQERVSVDEDRGRKEGPINEQGAQDEEREDYGYYDEYDEVENSMGLIYNESDDNMDQITSSSPPSWTRNQVHDIGDYSNQVASPSTQQSLSSNSYSQDSQRNSCFTTQPAIEMELIYDLKGHVQQLHQEISELRKSIKCCINMQIKLQRSIKREVAAVLNQSDNTNGQHKSVEKVISTERCCLCQNMQVDSLFYRCGHMCTCFDCARELQLGSGKCPICRASIVDVVRAYVNS